MKKLAIVTMVFIFFLSACSGGVPTTETVPAISTTEPYPGGAYPVEQPGDTFTYPGPDSSAPVVDYSAYPAPQEPGLYSPQPGDGTLERAEVTVNLEDSGIILMESFPVQVVANMVLELPTPCHQPRVIVSSPDANQTIAMEIYAVVDPDTICAQVIAMVEVRASLGALPSGTYKVVVNGQEFKTFKID